MAEVEEWLRSVQPDERPRGLKAPLLLAALQRRAPREPVVEDRVRVTLRVERRRVAVRIMGPQAAPVAAPITLPEVEMTAEPLAQEEVVAS